MMKTTTTATTATVIPTTRLTGAAAEKEQNHRLRCQSIIEVSIKHACRGANRLQHNEL